MSKSLLTKQLVVFALTFILMVVGIQRVEQVHAEGKLYVLDTDTGIVTVFHNGVAAEQDILIFQEKPLTIAAGVNPSTGATILNVVGLNRGQSVLDVFENGGPSGAGGPLFTFGSGAPLSNPAAAAVAVVPVVINSLLRLDTVSTERFGSPSVIDPNGLCRQLNPSTPGIFSIVATFTNRGVPQ